MLKYVSEHNDFYKKRIKEYGITNPLDITQWPILTRKELQENRYNMFSDGYKAKYFNQQLRRQTSSGSSGIPVNVYWDFNDSYVSNISLWRKRFQWYGIRPNDKYIMFTLSAINVKSEGDPVYYKNRFSNILSVNVSLIRDDSGYDKLIDIINNFEPKWLYIQPFVLNKLIRTYIQTGKCPPKTLRYIESIGELLASDLHRRAIEFFKVSLANMYGSEEMNGIAYECPECHMHVLDDNVLVEVMKNGRINSRGIGESIITNLNNIAMPLIRYNQGDMIDLNYNNSTCQYSCDSPIINLIKGRTFETIQLDNDTELNSIVLLEIMAEVNNEFNGVITTYRYVYDTYRRCLQCYISLVDNTKLNWLPNIRLRIISILKNRGLFDKFSDFVLSLEVLNVSQKVRLISFAP